MGAGMIDAAAWDRTVTLAQETKNLEGSTVLTAAPTEGAYTNEIVTAAYAILDGLGVDYKGEAFAPLTVTLNEGGNWFRSVGLRIGRGASAPRLFHLYTYLMNTPIAPMIELKAIIPLNT